MATMDQRDRPAPLPPKPEAPAGTPETFETRLRRFHEQSTTLLEKWRQLSGLSPELQNMLNNPVTTYLEGLPIEHITLTPESKKPEPIPVTDLTPLIAATPCKTMPDTDFIGTDGKTRTIDSASESQGVDFAVIYPDPKTYPNVAVRMIIRPENNVPTGYINHRKSPWNQNISMLSRPGSTIHSFDLIPVPAKPDPLKAPKPQFRL